MVIGAVSQTDIEASIANYKAQREHWEGQLKLLEQHYTENKMIALKTLDMLSGATAALEVLLKSITDEADKLTPAPPVVQAAVVPSA